MQIQTHILSGAAVGIAFAPNVACLLACMAGSIFPDGLDTFFSFKSRRRWERIHRTWSHNLGWWLVPVLIWLYFWPYNFKGAMAIVYNCAVFFYIGVLSHLALDFLNPTGIGVVPFFSRSRIGLSLVKTGSAFDRITGALLLVCAVVYRANEGIAWKSFIFFGKV